MTDPKWHIHLELILGTWVIVILRGTENMSTGSANELETALAMAQEMFDDEYMRGRES